MALIHLIYTSSLCRGVAEDEVARILDSSARHNSAGGITGMLLYDDGNFLQVLEGAPDAVHETYQRILRDVRHHQTYLLLEEPIAARDFPDWSMGFRNLNAVAEKDLPEQARHFKFDFGGAAIRGRPGDALDLLRQFSTSAR
jgi:hypothetical protein